MGYDDDDGVMSLGKILIMMMMMMPMIMKCLMSLKSFGRMVWKDGSDEEKWMDGGFPTGNNNNKPAPSIPLIIS